MTTTTDRSTRPGLPNPTPADLERAAALIDRAGLRMRRRRPGAHTVEALARVLAAHPSDHPHIRLLEAALSRRSEAERAAGRRPDPERAVRRLLERGWRPTEGAVRGWLADEQTKRAATTARAARIAPLVERDGATVARFVADYRRRHRRDPTRGKVIHRMRREWRASDGEAIVTAMLAAGWLVATYTPGSQPPNGLAPGPRARGLT